MDSSWEREIWTTERNICAGKGTSGLIIPLNHRIWYSLRVHQGSGVARLYFERLCVWFLGLWGQTVEKNDRTHVLTFLFFKWILVYISMVVPSAMMPFHTPPPHFFTVHEATWTTHMAILEHSVHSIASSFGFRFAEAAQGFAWCMHPWLLFIRGDYCRLYITSTESPKRINKYPILLCYHEVQYEFEFELCCRLPGCRGSCEIQLPELIPMARLRGRVCSRFGYEGEQPYD